MVNSSHISQLKEIADDNGISTMTTTLLISTTVLVIITLIILTIVLYKNWDKHTKKFNTIASIILAVFTVSSVGVQTFFLYKDFNAINEYPVEERTANVEHILHNAFKNRYVYDSIQVPK